MLQGIQKMKKVIALSLVIGLAGGLVPASAGAQQGVERKYFLRRADCGGDDKLRLAIRNGSDAVLKQYVWGLTYVDELVQTSLNSNPSGGDQCTDHLWAMQDANFNVLGVVTASGGLLERYEYTPYGQRMTYFSVSGGGGNDPRRMAATHMSRRYSVSGASQPYGRLAIGHQGLLHEDETLSGNGGGLVYNRARHLHTMLGRFVQRDPLGYVDGLSLYQYARANPRGWLDPTGWEPERKYDYNPLEKLRRNPPEGGIYRRPGSWDCRTGKFIEPQVPSPWIDDTSGQGLVWDWLTGGPDRRFYPGDRMHDALRRVEACHEVLDL